MCQAPLFSHGYGIFTFRCLLWLPPVRLSCRNDLTLSLLGEACRHGAAWRFRTAQVPEPATTGSIFQASCWYWALVMRSSRHWMCPTAESANDLQGVAAWGGTISLTLFPFHLPRSPSLLAAKLLGWPCTYQESCEFSSELSGFVLSVRSAASVTWGAGAGCVGCALRPCHSLLYCPLFFPWFV